MSPHARHFVYFAAPAARPFDRLRTGQGRFRGPGWWGRYADPVVNGALAQRKTI